MGSSGDAAQRVPPEPACEDGSLALVELVVSLEQALRAVDGGVEWLSLVLAGCSARESARMLKKDKSWLVMVQDVCRRVLV